MTMVMIEFGDAASLVRGEFLVWFVVSGRLFVLVFLPIFLVLTQSGLHGRSQHAWIILIQDRDILFFYFFRCFCSGADEEKRLIR